MNYLLCTILICFLAVPQHQLSAELIKPTRTQAQSEALLRLGKLNYAQKNYVIAYEYLDKAIQDSDSVIKTEATNLIQDTILQIYAAAVAMALGEGVPINKDKATQYFELLTNQTYNMQVRYDAMLYFVTSLTADNKQEVALPYLQELATQTLVPQYQIDAYLLLGQLYFQKGEYEIAQLYMKKVAKKAKGSKRELANNFLEQMEKIQKLTQKK